MLLEWKSKQCRDSYWWCSITLRIPVKAFVSQSKVSWNLFLRPRYLRKGPNLETQALDKGKESKSGRAIMASLPLLDFGFDSDTNAKQSVGLILNIFQSSAETGKWFFDRLVMKEGSHCSICYPPHHLLDMEVLFWDFPIKDKSHKWELVLCTCATIQLGTLDWPPELMKGRAFRPRPFNDFPPRQIQPRVSLYVRYDTTLEQICTPASSASGTRLHWSALRAAVSVHILCIGFQLHAT